MSGSDSIFLHSEGGGIHGHSVAVLTLDPGEHDRGVVAERIVEVLGRRAGLVPALTTQIAEMPLGLGQPRRFHAPDFDAARHVRLEVFLDGASRIELEKFVGEMASRPLDRTRPLWELTLVDGLHDGSLALVAKIHHSIADGAKAVDIMLTLLDVEPGHADEPIVVPDRVIEQRPSSTALLADMVGERVRHPLGPIKAGVGLTRALGAVATAPLWAGRGRFDVRGVGAPTSPLNGTLDDTRAVAFGQVSLSSLHRARRGSGGATLNDVLLAACAGGLRRYLDERGCATDRELVASVPISTRAPLSPGETPAPGELSGTVNELSSMFVRLPVDRPMNMRRLRSVRNRTINSKRFREVAGRGVAANLVELVPPVLVEGVGPFGLAPLTRRMPPAQNLVVSNVVGPSVPMYLAGARLLSCNSFAPLPPGCGLSITAMSRDGSMDLGVMVCPSIVPDPDAVLEEVVAEMGQLAGDASAQRLGPRRSRPHRIIRL